MEWKLYYGNGSTFSSVQGSPLEAPALNVQIVGQADEQCGRILMSGKDYYVFHNGEWLGLDLFGVIDHFMNRGLLKSGRTITNEAFRSIMAQALADKALPSKSAKWDATELNRPAP